MFRPRNKSNKQAEFSIQSSLDSGNASIKRTIPSSPIVYYSEEEQQHDITTEEEYQVNQVIDLQQQQPSITSINELTIESMSAVIAAAVQLSATSGAKSSLSLGSASILQPLSNKTETPVTTTTTTTKTITTKRRFSTRLFSSWSTSTSKSNNNSSGNTSPTIPTTPGLEASSFGESNISSVTGAISDEEDVVTTSPRSSSASNNNKMDDGRDELAYRGIQIKEIKTTLKPLVISDEVRNPMPEVKLERPGFARISY